MSTFIISNGDLVSAVKKASVSEKNTYELKVAPQVEPNSGKYMASLCTCNGSVQTIAFLLVTSENVTEEVNMIFPSTFSKTVTTLAAYTDADFKIEVNESICSISCGEASIKLDMLPSAVRIEPLDPNTNKFAQVTVETGKLKRAIEIGSSAMSSEEGKMAAVRNAVELAPVTIGGVDQFRVISVDTLGVLAAGAMAEIKQAGGLDDMLNKKTYVLNSVFCRIVNSIHSETVDLFLFDKQVMMRDGNDFYVITPNAASFPEEISAGLYADMPKEYSMSVEQKSLTSALDIVLIGASSIEDNKACLSISNGIVEVRALKRNNRAGVTATDVAGETAIGVNGALLKRAIAHLGTDITISGVNPQTPIFIKNGDPGVAVFAAPCQIEADSDAEKTSGEEEMQE